MFKTWMCCKTNKCVSVRWVWDRWMDYGYTVGSWPLLARINWLPGWQSKCLHFLNVFTTVVDEQSEKSSGMRPFLFTHNAVWCSRMWDQPRTDTEGHTDSLRDTPMQTHEPRVDNNGVHACRTVSFICLYVSSLHHSFPHQKTAVSHRPYSLC